MQTIYAFVYKKINQNKVMSGSTQYSKRKILVLAEIAGLLDHSYNKCALDVIHIQKGKGILFFRIQL